MCVGRELEGCCVGKIVCAQRGRKTRGIERGKSESRRQSAVITIPVTTGAAALRGDPGSLKQRSKAAPKGLMGRQRSTTSFLTHHMLKEFAGALWV